MSLLLILPTLPTLRQCFGVRIVKIKKWQVSKENVTPAEYVFSAYQKFSKPVFSHSRVMMPKLTLTLLSLEQHVHLIVTSSLILGALVVAGIAVDLAADLSKIRSTAFRQGEYRCGIVLGIARRFSILIF